MAGYCLSSDEMKELNRLIQTLWSKLVQTIAHSRTGLEAYTISLGPRKGSSWFNMEVTEDISVREVIEKSKTDVPISTGKVYYVETLLQTMNREKMVLEVWQLSIGESSEACPSVMFPIVHDRMSILLKTALTISRTTPGYKFSFLQGPQSYIMMYRVCFGTPNLELLGENYATVSVGQVQTPISRLTMHLFYRTQLTISPSEQKPVQTVMEVKPDHFKVDLSPRCCNRTQDGERRTPTFKKISCPFAGVDVLPETSLNKALMEYLAQPELNNIVSNFVKKRNKEKKEKLLANKDEFTELDKPKPEDNITVGAEFSPGQYDHYQSHNSTRSHLPCEPPNCKSPTISDLSVQMEKARITEEGKISSTKDNKEEDYVWMEVETPFADDDEVAKEPVCLFNNFFSAPPLFSEPVKPKVNLSDQLKYLNSQTKGIETFVKSFQEGSNHGSGSSSLDSKKAQ